MESDGMRPAGRGNPVRKPSPADARDLIARARAAASRTYSPYSHFPVGAALLCTDRTVVTGTNVENRSYGLAICAERSAVVAAVSEGKKEFAAVAVACPGSPEPVSPCGACRQVLSEFCAASTPVYLAGAGDEIVTTTIGELLPRDGLHDLKDRLR
jgi:cytidine deaminase